MWGGIRTALAAPDVVDPDTGVFVHGVLFDAAVCDGVSDFSTRRAAAAAAVAARTAPRGNLGLCGEFEGRSARDTVDETADDTIGGGDEEEEEADKKERVI